MSRGRETSPEVVAALEAFLAALEEGTAPDREEFLARYPGVADELRPCLDALAFVHGATERPGDERAEIEGESLGDFRLVRELGRGGMGVVYEAEQRSLGRRVALKVLPFAAVLDERQLHRFRFEAQAAALLHHSHIVPVYAVGTERGVHYYAMQYIEGRTLQQLVDELKEKEAGGASRPASGPLGAITTEQSSKTPGYCRAIARVGADVADALDYAHGQGVIHRDVKPANLMVDAGGHVWVTDFGLARSTADTGLTLTGDLVGTARYMSPEQTRGRSVSVDHRADVYSLGATLYEALTLTPAFPGGDVHAVLRDIPVREPVPPRRLNPAVAPELETIVLKALAKEAEGRYDTAAEMAADLRRFLDHKPILARPPTLLDVASKWALRHRGLVAATVVFLVLAVVVFAVATVRVVGEQRRTQAALDEAERSYQRAVEAVDALLFEVAIKDLQDVSAMTQVQQKLLQRALEFYDLFLADYRDDARLALRAAQAQRRRAELLVLLGREDEARDAVQKASGTLAVLDDSDPDILRERAQVRMRESMFAATDRDYEKALALAQDALERLRAVEGATGTSADLAGVARALRFVGDKHDLLGQREEGVAAFEEAIAIQRNVVARTDDPERTTELADLVMELGKLHLHERPPTTAERYFREALALLEEIPGHPNARKILAPTLVNLAYACATTGRLDEAVRCYDRASMALRSLVRDYPAVPSYSMRLARCYGNWAVSYTVNGLVDKARSRARRAVEVARAVVGRFPTPGWRQALADHLMTLGHLARAEHPEELEKGVALYTECLEIWDELASEVEGAESHRARAFQANDGKPSYGFAQDHPDYRAKYYVMRTYRGRYRFDLGREHEALADFEARAEGLPCADAFEDLAKVRILSEDESLHNLELGAELARQAIDADRNHRECWLLLGLALYLRGDHAGAVAAIERMVREKPHYAEWILAAAYHALGDEERSAAARARAEEWLRDIEAGPWGLNRLQRFCRDTALAALD